MSLGVLRSESFTTPFKVANAVPTAEVLTTETVHKYYAIQVVSDSTRMIARVSYATAAFFLI